ncbi:MAG: hypothetical protein PHH54_03760 [Candidatus Nanoarchaeia archaeon]|nr:hypothetical protein [Candidatus Nanoarchaeia archaeon]MDD5741075.1 hypothetical protein [Candidatus Nanoarchaeia archaeon]
MDKKKATVSEEYLDKNKNPLKEGWYINVEWSKIGFACKCRSNWEFNTGDGIWKVDAILSRYMNPIKNEEVQEEIDTTRDKLNFLTSKLEKLAADSGKIKMETDNGLSKIAIYQCKTRGEFERLEDAFKVLNQNLRVFNEVYRRRGEPFPLHLYGKLEDDNVLYSEIRPHASGLGDIEQVNFKDKRINVRYINPKSTYFEIDGYHFTLFFDKEK